MRIQKNSPSATNIEGTLHIDRYLTDFSVMFVQDSARFIAQSCASVIPVLKQTDKFVVYDRGYFWRDEAAPRPLGGRPVQVGYKIGEGTYSAVEFALEHTVDDRQRANADDPIRLDENATILLTQKHLIKQDRVWAQNFFRTGVWTTNYEGVASTPGSLVRRRPGRDCSFCLQCGGRRCHGQLQLHRRQEGDAAGVHRAESRSRLSDGNCQLRLDRPDPRRHECDGRRHRVRS